MKKTFLLTILLLANTFALFADDPGTPPCDPDQVTCPIDTWVIVFAAAVLIITTIRLHKRQTKAAKFVQ